MLIGELKRALTRTAGRRTDGDRGRGRAGACARGTGALAASDARADLAEDFIQIRRADRPDGRAHRAVLPSCELASCAARATTYLAVNVSGRDPAAERSRRDTARRVEASELARARDRQDTILGHAPRSSSSSARPESGSPSTTSEPAARFSTCASPKVDVRSTSRSPSSSTRTALPAIVRSTIENWPIARSRRRRRRSGPRGLRHSRATTASRGHPSAAPCRRRARCSACAGHQFRLPLSLREETRAVPL